MGAEAVVCGGADSSSNAVYFSRARSAPPLGGFRLSDSLLHDCGSECMGDKALGSVAEHVAQKLGITREQQDAYAVKAASAAARSVSVGLAAAQMDGVRTTPKAVANDEEVARFTPSSVKGQASPYSAGGTVTFGNSAKPGDGACLLLLGTEALARQAGSVGVEIVGSADAEGPRLEFLLSPAIAVAAALSRAKLRVGDVDCWNIQESFAVGVLATCQRLGLSPDSVNCLGGSLGFGHSTGMAGSFQLLNLAYELQEPDKQLGVAVSGNAGGGSTAVILRKVNFT